jgi:hypothetical protein
MLTYQKKMTLIYSNIYLYKLLFSTPYVTMIGGHGHHTTGDGLIFMLYMISITIIFIMFKIFYILLERCGCQEKFWEYINLKTSYWAVPTDPTAEFTGAQTDESIEDPTAESIEDPTAESIKDPTAKFIGVV